MRAPAPCLSVLSSLSLAAQAELKLALGITPAQNIFNKIQAPFEQASGLKLLFTDARSPAAWALLDEGKVEGAAAGLTWENWMIWWAAVPPGWSCIR